MEDQELLKYAIERDMISMSYIKDKYEMDKRKKYLEKHPCAVWEGKNGLKSRFLVLWNFGKNRKVTKKATKQEKKTEGGNSFMYDKI